MSFKEENIVGDWLFHLKSLNVEAKKCLAVIVYTVTVRLLGGSTTVFSVCEKLD